MKKLFFLMVVFSLVFGCNKTDEFPADEDLQLKSAKLNMVFVPFKGDFKIWIESFEENGPDRTQVMVGTGNLTHLGKTDFYADEKVSMEFWTGEEDVTFTAANKDKLFAHLTNVIDPSGYPMLIIEGEGYFTGGTGRFENAEGTLNYHATFNVDNNKGEKSFKGEIKW